MLYPAVSHAVRSSVIKEKFVDLALRFEWKPENIQFSTFKKCLNRDGYILRVFENQGKKTTVTIDVGYFQEAWKSNMDEATLEFIEIIDGCINIEVPPYKAISIKLR